VIPLCRGISGAGTLPMTCVRRRRRHGRPAACWWVRTPPNAVGCNRDWKLYGAHSAAIHLKCHYMTGHVGPSFLPSARTGSRRPSHPKSMRRRSPFVESAGCRGGAATVSGTLKNDAGLW